VGFRSCSSREREPTPILTWGLAGQLAKRPGEIGLPGKSERECDIDQRPLSFHQHCLGARQAFHADVSMGRMPGSGLERPREMESAQARNRREAGYREIPLQISLNKIQYTRQSASI
jgi:hypothetical protein